MDIDVRIRSRIEAILANDAKGYAELEKMSVSDEPLEADAFEEERNFYQRIINNYRSAVSEVNSLLEENVGFLSAFYRVVENIKEKQDFQEICYQVIDCVLQDLGAEYCSIVFFDHPQDDEHPSHLEGVREDRQFVRVHSNSSLLGSAEFDQAVARLVLESTAHLNIEDVYQDSRFNAVDFPSVVRSLVCLPVTIGGTGVGALILSHSQPRFFSDNHLRVLRILASTVAHLKLLTSGRPVDQPARFSEPCVREGSDQQDLFSIILLDFQRARPSGRTSFLDQGTIRSIRSCLYGVVEAKESLLLHGELKLLLLLPGTSGDLIPAKLGRLRDAFQLWKSDQEQALQSTRMNIGFATCENGEDLARTLEVASLMMPSETDEDPGVAVPI